MTINVRGLIQPVSRELPLCITGALAVAALVWLYVPTHAHAAKGFEPVTAEQKALDGIPFDRDADAVVLFRRGRLRFMNYPTEVSSLFEVEVRIKVLTEAGKSAGEIEIPHSRFYRLTAIDGRTVLPDGREIDVPADSIFKEQRSRTQKYYATKLVFPAVEVGAILDYKYVMRWDSLFFLEPWYFDGSLPTVLSEITYEIPNRMSVKPWSVRSTSTEMHSDLTRAPKVRQLKVWMENLRAIPEEPYSLPTRALASRVMMVPTSVNVSGQSFPLLDSWRRTRELFEEVYNDFTGSKAKTKKLAREIAADQPSLKAQIEAMYQYVRDEILTTDGSELGIAEGRRADEVLTDKQGTGIEKALVLKSMLETLKLKSFLVWATRRSEGVADMGVANPWWFDRAMVGAEIESGRLFLDPSDRGLAAGRIAPDFEGAQALLLVPKKPEVITLPVTGFEDSARHAVLKLTLDDDGRFTGSGTMKLTGHHAWRRLRWKDDDAATHEAWEDWIVENYSGYEVKNVTVKETVEEQAVEVGWTMAQREEEVLGDEVTVIPSQPFGPIRQPFTLEPGRRLTPGLMQFADRDDLSLEISWPPGWKVEVAPENRQFDSSSGSLAARVEHDAAGNKLRYSRRLDLRQAMFRGPDDYKAMRDLFDWVEKSDAQRLVLVAR